MKEKLLSGRLWLTLMAGFVFAYCSCKGILKPEAISALLAAVFTAYFNKKEDK